MLIIGPAIFPRHAQPDSGHPLSSSSVLIGYGIGILLYASAVFFASWGVALKGLPLRAVLGSRWLDREYWIEDVLVGIGLAVLSLGVTATLVYVLPNRNVPLDEGLMPRNALELALALPLLVAVAVGEEFLCRGYLFRQIHALNRHWGLAVCLQAAVFAFAHGLPQTPAAVVSRFFDGAMWGLVAWKRSSLLPVMVAHFLFNATLFAMAYWVR